MRKTSCSVFNLMHANKEIKDGDGRFGVLLLRWKRCTFKCSTTSHSKGNCVGHIWFAKKTLRGTLQNTKVLYCLCSSKAKRCNAKNEFRSRSSSFRKEAFQETDPVV